MVESSLTSRKDAYNIILIPLGACGRVDRALDSRSEGLLFK